MAAPSNVQPYLGLWRVTSVTTNSAGYPNVQNGSLMCLVWSEASSAVRLLHGSNYVLNNWADPKSWAQATYQYAQASGNDPNRVIGTVDGIPVRFWFNGSVFTCDVDYGSTPPGTWTGDKG